MHIANAHLDVIDPNRNFFKLVHQTVVFGLSYLFLFLFLEHFSMLYIFSLKFRTSEPLVQNWNVRFSKLNPPADHVSVVCLHLSFFRMD